MKKKNNNNNNLLLMICFFYVRQSGLLDVSVNAALFLVAVACAFSLSESGAFGSTVAQDPASPDAAMVNVVSSALGSWTLANLVWSLVGRILLGISVSSREFPVCSYWSDVQKFFLNKEC